MPALVIEKSGLGHDFGGDQRTLVPILLLGPLFPIIVFLSNLLTEMAGISLHGAMASYFSVAWQWV
jgi:hypothetical protein